MFIELTKTVMGINLLRSIFYDYRHHFVLPRRRTPFSGDPGVVRVGASAERSRRTQEQIVAEVISTVDEVFVGDSTGGRAHKPHGNALFF